MWQRGIFFDVRSIATASIDHMTLMSPGKLCADVSNGSRPYAAYQMLWTITYPNSSISTDESFTMPVSSRVLME